MEIISIIAFSFGGVLLFKPVKDWERFVMILTDSHDDSDLNGNRSDGLGSKILLQHVRLGDGFSAQNIVPTLRTLCNIESE